MKRKEEKYICPKDYLPNCGQAIDMLGKTELWRIHEHHTEPHLTRLPQDLVDDIYGSPCAARVPDDWGRCLYYKVV